MIPQTQSQWQIQGQNGLNSLAFVQNAPIPHIGDHDVLVQVHAASLNFKDLVVPTPRYPFQLKENVVPVSDGAGVVVAVGDQVTRFKLGDQVAAICYQTHLSGSINNSGKMSSLGSVINGVLQQYAAFSEQGLVRIPANLNMLEAATLPCAALTSWNALYGLDSKALRPGDSVLTQGSGGVSVFAIQLAKVAGAKVIATTSSEEKARKLRALGADHVINYREVAEWGELAKSLTPEQEGVSHVIEVGGSATMRQSLTALKPDGLISIIGALSTETSSNVPTVFDYLIHPCVVRGVMIGSRTQFEEMNRSIEVNEIRPVIDERVFKLEEAKEAYQYLADQKHFGKIVIQIV